MRQNHYRNPLAHLLSLLLHGNKHVSPTGNLYITGTLLLFSSFIFLFLLISCLNIPVAAETLDSWSAHCGDISVISQGKGEKVLQWHFKYNNDACFVTRKADSAWRNMSLLSFKVKSNRSAPLYLRFDQTDGSIFLLPFHCSEKWTTVDVDLNSLKPFGKTSGKFTPKKIENVFIVDLNGKDSGLTGSRSIWFKDFVFDSGATKSSVKRLKLLAFNSSGTPLTIKGFRRLGLSADQWCFITGKDGMSCKYTLQDVGVTIDGKKYRIPEIAFTPQDNMVLELLYWPVGADYKLWLRVDNGGRGIEKFQDDLILVNEEVIRTRLHELERFATLFGVTGLKPRIAEFREKVKSLKGLPYPKRAVQADHVMSDLLAFSRDAVFSASMKKIEARLAPSVKLSVIDVMPGMLSPGEKVSIRLEDPEFRIGVGQSFGFQPLRKDPQRIRKFYDRLKEAGFNHADMPLFWDQVVDDRGHFTDWEALFQFDYLIQHNFTLLAHGLVQTGMPRRIKRLQGERFVQAARAHLDTMIDHLWKRYNSHIILWELVNEPSSNTWGNLDVTQRVKMVVSLNKLFKKRLPDAVSMINDYDWQRGEELSPALHGRITGTYDFYRKLLRYENAPDVLGIEWYPGVRVKQPRFGVDMAEPCMDILDTYFYWQRLISLGKPLFLTESGFPGQMSQDDKNGYAWGRWTPSSQARAAVDTLALALSMKEIGGWVWWGITDTEPWNVKGGLFTADGREKPVLKALSRFISSLKGPYDTEVSSQGTLLLPSMPGKYHLTSGKGVEYIIYKNSNNTFKFISN